MDGLSIGVIAQRAGIATSAIRYYEHIGLLPPPGRSGGKRRYDEAVLKKLRVIRLAQQVGFSIAEIRVLLNGSPLRASSSERWQALAREKIAELQQRTAHLQTMQTMLEATLACRCESLEECSLELAPIDSPDSSNK